MKMPSTNTASANATNGAPANPANKTMEYEVLILPHGAGEENESVANPQQIRTKTKHISCNNQNGQMFWIPEGYRPLLVRTADLPLLVGTEYSSSSASDDGNDSN